MVDSETMRFMRNMVDYGMLKELTKERIWIEIEKTLNTKNPELFFDVLGNLHGAMEDIFCAGFQFDVNRLTEASTFDEKLVSIFVGNNIDRVHFVIPSKHKNLINFVSKYKDFTYGVDRENDLQFIRDSNACKQHL